VILTPDPCDPEPPESRRWCALHLGEVPEGHVFPLNDLAEHTDEDCECSPDATWPSDHPLYIHHAFDGREIIEQVEAGALGLDSE